MLDEGESGGGEMIGGKIKQVFKRPDKVSILVRDDNGDELVSVNG